MKISIPKEIKNNEFRVAITPAGVRDLVHAGHEVTVETSAGVGSGISDADYQAEGASIAPDAPSAWNSAEMVVKVKEPIASEYSYFRENLLLFTYLHLAAEPELTKALLKAKVTAIAYETVQGATGGLPLLAPMSEVAGRLSAIVGAATLMKPAGGMGLLVPGVPGTRPAHVVVLGGGVAGTNAISVAVGLGAEVTVLDTNLQRLKELDALYAGRIKTAASNSLEIERACLSADLVIGSVLIPGAKAPKLVSLDLVSRMKPGSVLVDIAVDQGGCFEGSRPTTHAEPTFQVHGSVYYCVGNMPGAVPQTSTMALTNATMRYVNMLASKGWKDALGHDAGLAQGLNTHGGKLTNEAVGHAHSIDTISVATVLS
ncbi:MAG: alanine dehydrogenase [Microbacteriaceae bacterium BACL25 MAG-120322-bin65]|jgi:alanine dehydrogenase|nr:MAG: alanine dehydrogenase [Microbacteriaceae bacterium BACL25 MAG-120322-bin65]|tara:strand:+ start:1380 stop:2495 length:1116 start_codon:yes stop_codon:yes gene_type:complete